MLRVDVKPELLRWARERSRLSADALAKRFPKLDEWEQRKSQPTLKQLEEFARATHTAIGFLFMTKPPVEKLPIPDFRTVASRRIERPSPDLLDTIYLCQQRQEWYHDFARGNGEEPLDFIGSAKVGDDVVATADSIRRAVSLDLEERRALPTWTDALRSLIDQAEALGVLVMVSGVVLNDNHRRLDPDEFRGFALSDEFAPVVFVNGADTKAAQMFTLAHELAHLWLGESAVSDVTSRSLPDHAIERWCNRIAAELLVPLAAFRREYRRDAELRVELQRLARIYKVSTLVVLRRMHDAGGLSWDELATAYDAEVARLLAVPRTSGGDFYLTQPIRLSRRFATALIASTRGGETLYTHAMRMLGIRKLETFDQLGRSLGVME